MNGIRGTGFVFSVALVAALVVVLASVGGASAQEPTPPTVEGLGECQPDHNVEILNDSANISPEDTVVRDSNGGFEAIFITNCIIYAVNFSIVDYEGKAVEGGVGAKYVHEQYSEIDYVPHSQYIEHKTYLSDYPDTETCQYSNTCTGDPIIDEQGIALQETPPLPVTAYQVKFTFVNPVTSRGDGALNRAAFEGFREARGGQIGEDYRASGDDDANPLSPSGLRFREAAADYNRIVEHGEGLGDAEAGGGCRCEYR